jgi:hypothetical protein
MRDLAFFQEIEHGEVPWGERTIHCPVFYYDAMMLGAQFLAPTEQVKALLPSARMHPLRVTPWRSIVSIVAFEYRDCDIGPYNEMMVGIPFTLDAASPLFTGILRKEPDVPKLYIHSLPVTTEIARDAGIDFASYPKFLADIQFDEQDGWLSCHLSEGETLVLTLAVRKLETRPVPRFRMHPMTVRGGHLLRSELIMSEREQAVSTAGEAVRLELGEHPLAQQIRSLSLGRMVGFQVCPRFQAVLTPVVESFAV